MKKVLVVSFVISLFCLVFQLGVLGVSQQNQPAFPPVGPPNNCDQSIDVPHGARIPPDPNAPQPPAGPPCPPLAPVPPAPPAPSSPAPLPPVGPDTCVDPNDPFGPGPHIAGQLPTGPQPPAGPPPPPCPQPPQPPQPPVVLNVSVDMLLPPKYRVGSAPFVWIKTSTSSYVYLIDVDPQRQVFRMPGVAISSANSWHLFGEGAWLGNPIGTDSMNAVVSSSPLPAYLEAAIMDSQNYVWGGTYYILNQSVQQQLSAVGASYIHQGYEITN